MKKPISFILILCMVLAMMPMMSITASAATDDIFTANIQVGGENVPCTFKVLNEQDGATPAAVQIGIGGIGAESRAIPTTAAGVIIIPSIVSNGSNNYNVTKIGDYAFWACTSLSAIEFASGSNITTIGVSAFASCRSLTGELIIPSSVTSIGDRAFLECNKLTGTLEIPASTQTIGASAFESCTSFSALRLTGSALTSIAYQSFRGCTGFAETLTIPASVTSIEEGAFLNCAGLPNLQFATGSALTSIGTSAFDMCSRLTNKLEIPETVTSIGVRAFAQCENLTGTLTIPASVKTIGNEAFIYCEKISGLQFATGSAITSIGTSAFYRCHSLAGELNIPSTITLIRDSAFYYCYSLTGTLEIPASITSIGIEAFSNCRGFSSLQFASGSAVTSIGQRAFYNCTGLSGNVVIPNKVNYIADGAFNQCSEVTSLEFQRNSLASVSTDAFKACSKLNMLIVPAAWTGSDSVTLNGITTPFAIGTGSLVKDAGLNSVLGQTTTASGGGIGSTTGTAINYSIDVANAVAQVAAADIVQSASSAAILYSDAGFSANENAPILLSAGGATTAYIKVTRADTGTTRYHAVTINRAGIPTISINDPSVTEGNSGITMMTFIVTLSQASGDTVTVNYATAQNTATAGSDFTAASGSLTFPTGATTQAIEVTVNGDTLDEDNEAFYVYLSSASGGTAISDGQGTGTITDDDDAPTISINDASVSEGNSGTTTMTFTVTLSEDSGKTVTVNYATADNTATLADSDYSPVSGSLTFGPGETTKTITVTANSDTTPEPDETFTVNLAGAYNATISDGQGMGTINNDDLADEATPAAEKDYINEKLTGITASAVYNVNGVDKTSDASGQIAIENSWLGTTISLVKKGNGTTTTNSAIQSIPLAARPATPACTATQPSASSATGVVSGISSTMQFSINDGSSWTDGTGSDISGLAPGAVLIRVKATGSAPASLNQTITITAYSAPPSGGGGGGGGTSALVTKIESGDSVAGANVDKLVKEGKALTVEGKTGEKLVFDTEALKNIDGQTKDSVKVEIKDVSADYKNEHPDRLVVSLSITAGGKHITSFGNGTATVALPYELKAGEKAEDVTVWYLAEDGKMTEVPCTYDSATKLATFKVNHFSLYVVGTADTSKWTNPFSDVKESSWFYDAVRYVSANKMMQGTDDKSFSPSGKTTRGMIVTILWRMENQPKVAKETTFADVKDGRYYHDAVAWASEKGIASGYTAEQFGPENDITREQLAVILYNYAASKGYNMVVSGTPFGDASGDLPANLTAFSDAGKIHSWGKEALSWANAEGLINGTERNLLDPLGAAERCQVAAILQRLVENTVK